MPETAAKGYLNSPRGVRFNGFRMVVSSLYEWYASDFGGSAEAILDHIRKYADPALAERLGSVRAIGDYEYDWALNDKK